MQSKVPYFTPFIVKIIHWHTLLCCLGAQDLSSHIPNADTLAKIESDGFAPEAFVSRNSKTVSACLVFCNRIVTQKCSVQFNGV